MAAIPGSSAAAIAQAKDEARRRAPNYGKLFAHLSRTIRQTILLQAYLVAGRAPTHDALGNPQRQAAQTTTENPQPDRDTLRRDTLDRLDCALPTGPDGEIPVEHLLRTISERFGLEADHSPADPTPADPTPEDQPPPDPARIAPETRTQTPRAPDIAPHRAHRRW